jgi:hypothetical protein
MGNHHKAVLEQRRVVPWGWLGGGASLTYRMNDHKIRHKFSTEKWTGAVIMGAVMWLDNWADMAATRHSTSGEVCLEDPWVDTVQGHAVLRF